MKTLFLNRSSFLFFYFSGINFTENVYVGLLNDGKYEINLTDLLESVASIPEYVLEPYQDYDYLPNGDINIENVKLKIK